MSETATTETTTQAEPTTTEDNARPAESEKPAETSATDAQKAADPVSGTESASATGSPDKPADKPDHLSEIDKRLAQVEAAMKAERERKAAAKPEEKTPEKKEAHEVTNADLKSVPEAAELLKQGKRAEAVLAFLKDQADDDLLLELAPLLEGKVRKVPTEEEKWEQWYAAKEKAKADEAAKKAAEEEAKKKADEEKQAEADKAELETFLKNGAKFAAEQIKAGKYPFLADFGIDTAEYRTTLFDLIKETKKVPSHEDILNKMETARESTWRKSRYAGKPDPSKTVAAEKEETIDDFDEQIRKSFEDHRGTEVVPIYGSEEDDEARAMLVKVDREERRNWR